MIAWGAVWPWRYVRDGGRQSSFNMCNSFHELLVSPACVADLRAVNPFILSFWEFWFNYCAMGVSQVHEKSTRLGLQVESHSSEIQSWFYWLRLLTASHTSGCEATTKHSHHTIVPGDWLHVFPSQAGPVASYQLFCCFQGKEYCWFTNILHFKNIATNILRTLTSWSDPEHERK